MKKILAKLIVFSAFLFITAGVRAQACCVTNVQGDLNCDNKLSVPDYGKWRTAYLKLFGGGGTASPPPPSMTPPPSTVKPVGTIPGTFTLVFQDEFNGTTLDMGKWNLGTPWGGDFCQGEEHFTNTNWKVENGNLDIIYTRRATALTRSGCPTALYDTSMIQSKGKVTVQSGQYIEWRLKPAKGRGFWNIAWIMPNSWPQGSCAQRYEMDVFEHLGKDGGTTAAATTHIGPNCQLSTDTKFGPAIDWTQDFHTAGVNWFPDRTEIYFDGQKVFTSSKFNASYNEPGFLMMNGFLGSAGNPNWAGPSDSSTPATAHFLIDYVRVWNRN